MQAKGMHVIPGQYFQHFAQGYAASTGWRRCFHQKTTVGTFYGSKLARFVAFKIRGLQYASMCLGLGKQAGSNGAFVKSIGSFVCNQFQRARQIFLDQPVTGAQGRAIGAQEYFAGIWVFKERRCGSVQEFHISFSQHKSVTGKLNGRFHNGLPGQMPPSGQHPVQSGNGTGYGNGFPPQYGLIGNNIALAVQIHVWCGCKRGFFPEVEKNGGLAGGAQHHKTTPTQITGCGVHDCQRIPHGDSGICCIPAFGQNMGTNIGCQLLGGHSHAMLPRHRGGDRWGGERGGTIGQGVGIRCGLCCKCRPTDLQTHCRQHHMPHNKGGECGGGDCHAAYPWVG